MLAMVNSSVTTAWRHGRNGINPHWNRNTWRKNYAKKMLAMVNSSMTTAWQHGRITVNPHWNRNTWRKNYAKKCWPWLIQV